MQLSRILSCITLLLHGCVSAYSPPGPVVPLLDERGDLSVGANLRPALPTRGASAYVAAAPSERSRVFVAGSLSRYSGERTDDYTERRMQQKNHTLQLEAGAGAGMRRDHLVLEGLAGIGFGKSEANQCRRQISFNTYGTDCQVWVDSRSWFMRPFVQFEAGGRYRPGAFGGGLRISVVRYAYDWLLGEPSQRNAAIVTVEPFFSASMGMPWGKVEIQFLVPLVASSPDVAYTRAFNGGGSQSMERTWQTPLVESATPRFTLGLRADLDELWRKR
jgi:hypothetical protein